MHPADEYAKLKAEIRVLEDQAKTLRAKFISGEAPVASNAVEVVVRRQRRRVFLRDRLPPHILNDPALWEERVSEVVTVRQHAHDAPKEEAFDVIDAW